MQQAASAIDKAATAYKRYIKSKSPNIGIRNFKTMSFKPKPKETAIKQTPSIRPVQQTKVPSKSALQTGLSNNAVKIVTKSSKPGNISKKASRITPTVHDNAQKNKVNAINAKKSTAIPQPKIAAGCSKCRVKPARIHPVVVDGRWISHNVKTTTPTSTPTDRQTEEARNILFQKLKESRMKRGKSEKKIVVPVKARPSLVAQNITGVTKTTVDGKKNTTNNNAQPKKLASTISHPANHVNKNVNVNLPARNKSVPHRSLKPVAPAVSKAQNQKQTSRKLVKSKPSKKFIQQPRIQGKTEVKS